MKALLLENVHPDAERILTERGYEVESQAGALSPEDLMTALEGVSLLGIRSATHVTAEVIAAHPQLQAVGAFCIGTNQIDLNAASDSGLRLGGDWMFIVGPKIRRATAMVQSCSSRSGSGAFTIRVPGLARKFWMMISCRCP